MINLCSGATMPAYELLTSVTLHGVYRTGTEVSTLCRVTWFVAVGGRRLVSKGEWVTYLQHQLAPVPSVLCLNRELDGGRKKSALARYLTWSKRSVGVFTTEQHACVRVTVSSRCRLFSVGLFALHVINNPHLINRLIAVSLSAAEMWLPLPNVVDDLYTWKECRWLSDVPWIYIAWGWPASVVSK